MSDVQKFNKNTILFTHELLLLSMCFSIQQCLYLCDITIEQVNEGEVWWIHLLEI
jgi:hypothetical protein